MLIHMFSDGSHCEDSPLLSFPFIFHIALTDFTTSKKNPMSAVIPLTVFDVILRFNDHTHATFKSSIQANWEYFVPF